MAARAQPRISALAVVLHPQAGSAGAAIDELVGALGGLSLPGFDPGVARAVREREAQAPTYFGQGVALPHARCGAERPWLLAFGRYSDGVPWGESGERAHLVFLSLIPAVASTAYLAFLQGLSRAMRDAALRSELTAAADEESVRRWMRAHLRAG